MVRSDRKKWSHLQRSALTLALGAVICIGMRAQEISVPGMSRYADIAFRFSFWYPTAWKVIDTPVTDPTRDGWFPDGKIVQELQLRNPDVDDDDQPPGVILQVLLAQKGLTELGRSKSPSPVGVDQRYFFDDRRHRWMYGQMTEAPNGAPPRTVPMKISRKTMGGLPLFQGAERGGIEEIVPLDHAHFLAVSLISDGGPALETYLAKTVMATRLGTGKPASAESQVETIRREAVKLRAIGESVGFWYKDNQHVYNFDGNVLPGADPKTFAPILRNGQISEFATDSLHVYRSYSAPVPGADPKTFVETGNSTAKDAHHTYDWSSGSLKVTP